MARSPYSKISSPSLGGGQSTADAFLGLARSMKRAKKERRAMELEAQRMELARRREEREAIKFAQQQADRPAKVAKLELEVRKANRQATQSQFEAEWGDDFALIVAEADAAYYESGENERVRFDAIRGARDELWQRAKAEGWKKATFDAGWTSVNDTWRKKLESSARELMEAPERRAEQARKAESHRATMANKEQELANKKLTAADKLRKAANEESDRRRKEEKRESGAAETKALARAGASLGKLRNALAAQDTAPDLEQTAADLDAWREEAMEYGRTLGLEGEALSEYELKLQKLEAEPAEQAREQARKAQTRQAELELADEKDAWNEMVTGGAKRAASGNERVARAELDSQMRLNEDRSSGSLPFGLEDRVQVGVAYAEAKVKHAADQGPEVLLELHEAWRKGEDPYFQHELFQEVPGLDIDEVFAAQYRRDAAARSAERDRQDVLAAEEAEQQKALGTSAYHMLSGGMAPDQVKTLTLNSGGKLETYTDALELYEESTGNAREIWNRRTASDPDAVKFVGDMQQRILAPGSDLALEKSKLEDAYRQRRIGPDQYDLLNEDLVSRREFRLEKSGLEDIQAVVKRQYTDLVFSTGDDGFSFAVHAGRGPDGALSITTAELDGAPAKIAFERFVRQTEMSLITDGLALGGPGSMSMIDNAIVLTESVLRQLAFGANPHSVTQQGLQAWQATLEIIQTTGAAGHSAEDLLGRVNLFPEQRAVLAGTFSEDGKFQTPEALIAAREYAGRMGYDEESTGLLVAEVLSLERWLNAMKLVSKPVPAEAVSRQMEEGAAR